jgi:hypothetical protein
MKKTIIISREGAYEVVNQSAKLLDTILAKMFPDEHEYLNDEVVVTISIERQEK